MRSFQHLFLCALVALAAVPAAATALCDEDDPRVEQSELETLPEVEQILPCAMVESGQLGSWCLDATFYVVSQSGTLLCRVLLPDVDLATSKSSDVTRRVPAPSPERVQSQTPPLTTSMLPTTFAPPTVSPEDTALEVALHVPQPVYREPPLVPG